jgi:hypothetical protein
MLHGRFGNTSGRPYISVRVVFPRLRVDITIPPQGLAQVPFLIDTGADLTTIMPADWSRFCLDINKLTCPFDTYGVGGKAEGFKETAMVTFLEPDACLRSYKVDIIILKPTPYIMSAPSLLGRDIIQHWAITFDKPKNSVTARVLHADNTVKVPKKTSETDPPAMRLPERTG